MAWTPPELDMSYLYPDTSFPKPLDSHQIAKLTFKELRALGYHKEPRWKHLLTTPHADPDRTDSVADYYVMYEGKKTRSWDMLARQISQKAENLGGAEGKAFYLINMPKVHELQLAHEKLHDRSKFAPFPKSKVGTVGGRTTGTGASLS